MAISDILPQSVVDALPQRRSTAVSINDSYINHNVRFPMPPKTGVGGFAFPSDLITGNRNYFTQLLIFRKTI
jgi:hypothetical protein